MARNAFLIPPVSHYASRKEWEAACWKKLIRSRARLEPLVTPRERHALVIRAAALERIGAGISYRRIADELWLSPQTISVLKKSVGEHGYRSYWERGKTERKRGPGRGMPDYHSGEIQNYRKTKYGRVRLH
ncbi:MAG: hypothetical protein Q7S84_03505 [bacterium]|nr:hypothetical protein [bacterium]